MNKQIQIKRNKPSGSNYRVLYAKTGRRRKLHAATTATANKHAGLGVDVPNLGVGKALFVILVLHVLAIAAIFIHSAYFGDSDVITADQGQGRPSAEAAKVVPPLDPENEPAPAKKKKPAPAKVVAAAMPKPEAMGRYIVVTGDSYPSVAEKHNVAEDALRALNRNRQLRGGVVLVLPAELSAKPVDPAPARAAKQRESKPSAPKAKVAKVKEVAEVAKPVVVKPARTEKSKPVNDVRNAPKAILIEDETAEPAIASPVVEDSGKTYTIRRGDTLWGISKRLKVSQDSILELNGIEDPNKLYSGRTIKIPAN